MGLVEYDDPRIGKHACIRCTISSRFDRQIGTEQMMIDDDDVAFRCPPAHLGDEAAIELLALCSNAAIGAGIEFRPQRAVFRQLRQFGAIARLGCLLPVVNNSKLIDLLQPIQHRLRRQVVKPLAAKIIAASFHVADAQLANMLGEKWRHILEEELFLQVLGAS